MAGKSLADSNLKFPNDFDVLCSGSERLKSLSGDLKPEFCAVLSVLRFFDAGCDGRCEPICFVKSIYKFARIVCILNKMCNSLTIDKVGIIDDRTRMCERRVCSDYSTMHFNIVDLGRPDSERRATHQRPITHCVDLLSLLFGSRGCRIASSQFAETFSRCPANIKRRRSEPIAVMNCNFLHIHCIFV